MLYVVMYCNNCHDLVSHAYLRAHLIDCIWLKQNVMINSIEDDFHNVRECHCTYTFVLSVVLQNCKETKCTDTIYFGSVCL